MMDEMNAMGDFDDDDFDARGGGSSGRVITLFRKRAFDFSFVQVSPASQTITIRKALKLPAFYHYWVGLRIHNVDIGNASSSIVLNLFNTLPSAQDPQEFSATAASISLTVNQTDTAPKLEIATSSNLGPYLKVQLTATGGSGVARLYAELSAVLLARSS